MRKDDNAHYVLIGWPRWLHLGFYLSFFKKPKCAELCSEENSKIKNEGESVLKKRPLIFDNGLRYYGNNERAIKYFSSLDTSKFEGIRIIHNEDNWDEMLPVLPKDYVEGWKYRDYIKRREG